MDSGQEQEITEDVGGVQGSPANEGNDAPPAPIAPPDNVPDQPAPDAGEIEWSGGLIKKPPSPGRA